jgi:L-2,4-diaminobutyrate decarboxylase
MPCQEMVRPDEPTLDGRNPCTEDFRRAFSAATFDASAEIAIGKIGELLCRKKVEGVTLEEPEELMAEARGLVVAHNGHSAAFDPERFAKIIDLYIRTSIKVGSTGYMARQFSSVFPIAAVFDMVTAISPQPASFYEAGQLANIADKIIAEEFARRIGWDPDTCDMITTSGGSLANLTAILAARNDRLYGSWKTGVTRRSNAIPTIAVSADIHYSVSRVLGIIGIGQDNILRLPLNDRRQICVRSAMDAIQDARAAGQDIFCLVASAGSTSIGAIDPLEQLADLAQAQGIWLHIDASHCGAYLISERLKSRLDGLERADSFCIDGHKTLFVPALCTLLFYRDRSKARGAFAQEASYVFDHHENSMTRFESGAKNFECTKRPAILNLWLIWAVFGPHVIAQKLEYLVDLTREAYSYLLRQPDFETVHEPEANILCFEYRPEGFDLTRISALQLALRDAIRDGGRFFVSKVEIDGRNVLRIVLMNHEIDMSHVAALVSEIRRMADEIMESWGVQELTTASVAQ